MTDREDYMRRQEEDHDLIRMRQQRPTTYARGNVVADYQPLTVRFSPEHYRKIVELARINKRSLGAQVEFLLEQVL